MAVSGSEDGRVIVWDVSRTRLLRGFHHEDPVNVVAIGPSGDIASASRLSLAIHTINGRMIASIRPFETIMSLSFLEREWTPVPVLASGAVGAVKLWTWNAEDTPEGEKARWKIVPLRTMECRRLDDGTVPVVTALEFVGESLYHGEDNGAVYSWNVPQ